MSVYPAIFLIATAAPVAPPAGVAALAADTFTQSTAWRPARAEHHRLAGAQIELVSSTSTNPSPAMSGRQRRMELSTPVGESIRALAKLRTFATWSDNWDGEGAPAPDSATIEAASNLLGMLEGIVTFEPKVALNGHGEPMFMLLDDDAEVSITLTAPNAISYYVYRDGIEAGGAARLTGGNVPRKVIHALRQAGLTHA